MSSEQQTCPAGSLVCDTTAWKALSLLHIEYPVGDFLGQMLAWASFLPIAIVVGLVTLILFRRDIHTMTFLFGLLVNTGFNWLLKRVIQEDRPEAAHMQKHGSFGMPSDHAQFMAFFSAYMTLFLLIRTCYRNSLRGCGAEEVWKGILTFVVWLSSALVCLSRVYLMYHTWGQVCAGALIGFVTGLGWFFIIHCCLTEFFPLVATWRISEYFMIRDYSLVPNALWFEYISCRSENRSRMRKFYGKRM